MPHFEFLSDKIRNVWEALGRTGGQYVLIGGTALAYRLGHRVSVDIDLCTSRPAEHPNVLRRKWNSPAIGKHKWLRRRPDHYIKFFETECAPKIDVHGKVPGGCLELPQTAPNGLRIASVTDILKQKLIAMCDREPPRDMAQPRHGHCRGQQPEFRRACVFHNTDRIAGNRRRLQPTDGHVLPPLSVPV